jgi:hypothetical protein
MQKTNEDLIPYRPERSKSLSHLITIAIIFVFVVGASGIAAEYWVVSIACLVAFMGIMHFGTKADDEERYQHNKELEEWKAKIHELGYSEWEAVRILEERNKK